MKISRSTRRGIGIVEKIIMILSLVATIFIMIVIANMPKDKFESMRSTVSRLNYKTLEEVIFKDSEYASTKPQPINKAPSQSEARIERTDIYLQTAMLELTTKNTSEKEVVKYKTEVINTSAMKKGDKKIIKKGSNGVIQIDKELVYKGEELKETNLNSKKIIKQPINEVVIQGVDSTVPILMVPTKGVYSSYFGARWGKVHKGVDIAACVGTPVGAAEGGVVTFSGDRGTYGKCVIIQHKSGYETLYAHNSKLVAKQGQVVYKGQVISHTGNTGRSTGPHLHFEVKKDGTAIDPIKLINK